MDVRPVLHDCNLEVKKGELVAVVGSVGSGNIHDCQKSLTVSGREIVAGGVIIRRDA